MMKHKRISEEEAYAQLRKRAMNEKKKIAEIAAAVVTGLEMLG
ncbi:ANTAR domain-containing protein [Raoultella ornithinolytica]